MRITFESVAERRECFRHIQEARREIDEDIPLLEALYELENGKHPQSTSGFGWVNLNEPDSNAVRFADLDPEEFMHLLDTLDNATAADLGDANDNQLATIADKLSETASLLRKRTSEDIG